MKNQLTYFKPQMRECGLGDHYVMHSVSAIPDAGLFRNVKG